MWLFCHNKRIITASNDKTIQIILNCDEGYNELLQQNYEVSIYQKKPSYSNLKSFQFFKEL